MLTAALDLALQREAASWETCPNCGLLFETKKTEGDTIMQFNLTVTGDVTPDIAPYFAQLLGGRGVIAVPQREGKSASCCGDAVTDKEKNYIINGDRHHLDCLRCMDTPDLMELLGYELQTVLGVAGE